MHLKKSLNLIIATPKLTTQKVYATSSFKNNLEYLPTD